MSGYSFLAVFVGAGVGGVLRYGFSLAAGAWLGTSFPWGTLAINAVGSFLMGVALTWFAGHTGAGQLRLLLTTGLLGGFTTFSAFSAEALALWQRGQPAQAAAYVLASLVLGIGGCWLGATR